ncbi:MAG: hypothetical protein C4310_06790, partial [Chloroflexota bacterium]
MVRFCYNETGIIHLTGYREAEITTLRRRRRPGIAQQMASCLGRLVAYLLILLIIAAFALLIYIQVRSNLSDSRPAPELAAPNSAQVLSRGEYLVKSVAQCWRCHSAPEAGEPNENAPLSGGRALALSGLGPGFGLLSLGLGTYYAANITPDPDTGIGRWTDGQIVRALREGVSRDGHMLFPIMPYQDLRGLSDEDALAIVAYLRSRPPVRNIVPPRQLSLAA